MRFKGAYRRFKGSYHDGVGHFLKWWKAKRLCRGKKSD